MLFFLKKGNYSRKKIKNHSPNWVTKPIRLSAMTIQQHL
jgi:hypothetical protein